MNGGETFLEDRVEVAAFGWHGDFYPNIRLAIIWTTRGYYRRCHGETQTVEDVIDCGLERLFYGAQPAHVFII